MNNSIKSLNIFLIISIAFVISLFRPIRLFAQQKTPLLNAQVVQISGQTFYLDAGQNQGISSGDTLTVFQSERGGTIRGRLLVIASSSSSSSVRYLNKPFPLTRGEELYLTAESTKGPATAEIPTAIADTVRRSSIMNKSPTTRTSSPVINNAVKPLVTGRIMAGSYMNFSQSRWSALDTSWSHQNYISPYMNMILRAARLPGNVEVNVNMRWSYRYMNLQPLRPASLFSLYQLQISKHWDKVPFTISIGRFYNRYEDFSGFWDGVMLRYGSYNNGIGIISGFEPDQSSAGFSSTIPKHSIFAYSSQPLGPIESSSEVSFNALYPKNNWLNHMYFGINQEFRYKQSSIGGSFQLDRSPLDNQWVVSEGYLHAHISLSNGFYLNGIWRRNYPYRLWLITNPFGFLQTQYGGGLSFNFSDGYLSGNILKDSGTWASNAMNYDFYGSYQLPFLNLGLNAQANFRDDKTNKALSFGGGIDRWFGSFQLSLQYQYYKTDYLNERILSHSVSAQINVPIMDKLYIDLQGQYQFGDLIMNKGASIGIWYNF